MQVNGHSFITKGIYYGILLVFSNIIAKFRTKLKFKRWVYLLFLHFFNEILRIFGLTLLILFSSVLNPSDLPVIFKQRLFLFLNLTWSIWICLSIISSIVSDIILFHLWLFVFFESLVVIIITIWRFRPTLKLHSIQAWGFKGSEVRNVLRIVNGLTLIIWWSITYFAWGWANRLFTFFWLILVVRGDILLLTDVLRKRA